MAAHVLAVSGYASVDPTHPLGGPDGGKDAAVRRDGQPWIMAAYFPRGEVTPAAVRAKYLHDYEGVAAMGALGMAFVTNQEMPAALRRELTEAVTGDVELFHLERLAHILDLPANSELRRKYLYIPGQSPNGPTGPSSHDQTSLDKMFAILSRVAVDNTLYYDFESAWRDEIVEPWLAATRHLAGAEWVIGEPEVESARQALLMAAQAFLWAEAKAIDHRQPNFRWLDVSDDDAAQDSDQLESLRRRARTIREAADTAAAAHDKLVRAAVEHGFNLNALRIP